MSILRVWAPLVGHYQGFEGAHVSARVGGRGRHVPHTKPVNNSWLSPTFLYSKKEKVRILGGEIQNQWQLLN